MHLLKLIRTLIALLIACGSGAALSCSDRQDWKDFSAVSLTTASVNLITLKRFTDGIYARIEDQKGPKEMYQLNNGVYLYRGAGASVQNGPSPFFMLDMPIGMTLSFLALHFKYPCLIESTPTPFEYIRPVGGKTIKVKGSANRINESAISFDFTAVEEREHGATIKASGTVEFLTITRVPLDTVISDWVVTYGSGIGKPATIVNPSQKIETINDLKYLAPEELGK